MIELADTSRNPAGQATPPPDSPCYQDRSVTRDADVSPSVTTTSEKEQDVSPKQPFDASGSTTWDRIPVTTPSLGWPAATDITTTPTAFSKGRSIVLDVGDVVFPVITPDNVDEVADAEGLHRDVGVAFTVVPRKRTVDVLERIRQINPTGFVTLELVRTPSLDTRRHRVRP